MRSIPETRQTLLARLRDHGDHAAWSEFVELYEPAVYRLGRHFGLQDSDAHDLVQNVLAAVARSVDDWDPDRQRGRFRNWLYSVAKNAVCDLVRRGAGRLRGQGGTSFIAMLERISVEDPAEARFELEYRREVFRKAAAIVERDVDAKTWRIFQRTVIDEEPIATAANQLGLSLGTAYTARNRVLGRLKKEVERLTGEERRNA
jgi:RNA polymerase sigma-70 factor (ECF subfamily)